MLKYIDFIEMHAKKYSVYRLSLTDFSDMCFFCKFIIFRTSFHYYDSICMVQA